jgi:hypothetical protein
MFGKNWACECTTVCKCLVNLLNTFKQIAKSPIALAGRGSGELSVEITPNGMLFIGKSLSAWIVTNDFMASRFNEKNF